jgi:hypothetical protein
MDYDIVFPPPDKGRWFNLVGYTDSNWCGDKDDRKSTAGYIFLVGGAPISWSARKEPEYIVASLCACQGVWLCNLMNEVTHVKCNNVIIKVDNLSAINLAKNPIAHGRSKHIEMRFHYLREQVSKGNIKLEYCRTELQVADLLAKVVTVKPFIRLKGLMGVESLGNMN